MKRFRTPLVLFLCMMLVLVAWASSGGGYTLDPYTVDGGGMVSSGGGFNVVGAIAQADVGTQVGGEYVLGGGFWAGMPKDTPTPTHTPTPTNTPIPGAELVSSGDMETGGKGKVPSGWLRVNPTSDRVKCNKPNKQFSHTGDCAYRFLGGVGENSILRQDVNLEGLTFLPGDPLWVTAYVDARNTVGARFLIKVKYRDGTPVTKAKLPIKATTGYQPLTTTLNIASADIRFIRVIFHHRSRTGQLRIDDVSVFKPDFGGALIPLPPASDFRSN